MAPRDESAPRHAETVPESTPTPLARGGTGNGGDGERAPSSVRPSVIRPAESAGRAAAWSSRRSAPSWTAGRYAVKRVAGEPLHVEADLFKEGHDVLVAVVRWRQVSPGAEPAEWREVPHAPARERPLGGATSPSRAPAATGFTVEAWPDLFATWVSELKRKVDGGPRREERAARGGRAAGRRAARAAPRTRPTRTPAARRGGERRSSGPPPEVIGRATEARVVDRRGALPGPGIAGAPATSACWVFADRERARAGAWYELFPRSAARDGKRHGTFRDAEACCP